MGNRTFPYSPTEVKEALAEQTGNFSSTVDFPEDKNSDLPVITNYHSVAARLPPLLENLPIATRNGPQDHFRDRG